MPQNAIVTGATGFVGRHVVAHLLRSGFRVTALVRDMEKAKRLKMLEQATIVQFDISDRTRLLDLKPDSVLIHCAWDNVRDTLSLKHIEEHYANNYFFVKYVVERGVGRVLITGSCTEYGLQYGPVTANLPPNPNTPYALAKDQLHRSLRLLQEQVPFQLLWARLFYMYGEGQDPKCIVPLFDRALERGDQVFNMSLGEQLIDYLPVEKVAEKIVYLLGLGDGVFNVCSGTPISLRRFLEQRMQEKSKTITLNLGYYGYRDQDSIAIWGADEITARD